MCVCVCVCVCVPGYVTYDMSEYIQYHACTHVHIIHVLLKFFV